MVFAQEMVEYPCMTLAVSDRLMVQVRTSIAAAVEYLYRKQSYNGAFCFYRYEHADHPNLGDTYHAVAALRCVGAAIPRSDELQRYLNELSIGDLNGLYHYTFTLEQLDRSTPISKAIRERIARLTFKRLPTDGSIPLDKWLESTLQAVQLQRRFASLAAHADLIRDISELKSAHGGYGEFANIWDTYLSLSILDELGENRHSLEDSRAFVDGLQQSSPVFTATLESRHTNLPIIAAGLRCCELIGLPVRHPEDILAFALACQSADGSFSRVPVALPNIELTHQAVTIIATLYPDLFSRGARLAPPACRL
jgi:hypothetical protein